MEKLAQQIKKFSASFRYRNWPKDWGLRLLSLFFAVFLWYFVVGEDKVDTSVFIPVEIVNLPRDLVISNQYKKQLEVTISGPRGLIEGLRRKPVHRTINLSKAKPGTLVVRNKPDDIPFPRGITVLRIQPTHITLFIDQLVEKNLPIVAKTMGKPPADYEVAQIRVEPDSITISGPKLVLDKEERLLTKPFSLDGLTATTTLQVALDLDEEILDLIGETVVSATVVIEEKKVEKRLNDIPLTST